MLIRILSLMSAVLLSPPLYAIEAKAEVFVALRPTATVEGRVVRLGDVAAVTTRGASEQGKYLSIEVSRLASLASPARVTREDIVRRVNTDHPELSGRLVWGGSNEVLVSGKPQRVDLETATNAAATYLMGRLGGGDLISLRLLDSQTAIEVPPGNVRSRPDMQAATRSGAVVEVPVIVEVDGVLAARPVLRFAVSRSPRAGNQAAAESATMPTTEQRGSPAADTDMTKPYLVSRQQKVTVLLESDGMRIESEGIALADARMGEQVRVRRTSGNVELAGRAIRQGVVLVEEN